ARSAMNVFGVHFAPQLAQAVEDQRMEARAARQDMSALRRRATTFAVIWVLAALAGSGLLYWFAGRPILSRISETVIGASQISSGQLERRLKPAGRDELTLLMIKFNRMADSFSRREAKLLDMQGALQDTIAERTSDLSSANTRLELIDTNRRRFFSDISHELRTPLTVIIGEAEVSLRHAKGADRATRASLETILARARNLRRRVDDLLRIARSESGKLDLDLEQHDLNLVLGDAIDDSQALAGNHGVELSAQLASRPLLARCDKEWLRQAVSGLLANAVKYSPSDTKIAVTLTERQGSAIIEIADQGYGISPKDLPKIFDRFYKGNAKADASAGGFGIGLSLIKWVVEEHGGTISAQSPGMQNEPDGEAAASGSVFTIRLPLPAR
ncbi:MAG: sensor histidine kinase, partial [Aestuariivirgaceae bacterium]